MAPFAWYHPVCCWVAICTLAHVPHGQLPVLILRMLCGSQSSSFGQIDAIQPGTYGLPPPGCQEPPAYIRVLLHLQSGSSQACRSSEHPELNLHAQYVITAPMLLQPMGEEVGRLYDPKAGGGALLDIGLYMLTLASWVYGCQKPSEVKASAVMHKNGIDVSGVISLKCVLFVECRMLATNTLLLPAVGATSRLPFFSRMLLGHC